MKSGDENLLNVLLYRLSSTYSAFDPHSHVFGIGWLHTRGRNKMMVLVDALVKHDE
jgi:hypothetical protein